MGADRLKKRSNGLKFSWAPRTSICCRKTLKRAKKMHTEARPHDPAKLGKVKVGEVWVPGSRVVLGREAGAAARNFLLRPAGEKFFEWVTARSPIYEIAGRRGPCARERPGMERRWARGRAPSSGTQPKKADRSC